MAWFPAGSNADGDVGACVASTASPSAFDPAGNQAIPHWIGARDGRKRSAHDPGSGNDSFGTGRSGLCSGIWPRLDGWNVFDERFDKLAVRLNRQALERLKSGT